ncbi:hypothetical protein TELCIR_14274, partial [Teladorsagia circumcincta]
HSILERTNTAESATLAMPRLARITVHVGEEWGKLLMSHNYDNLKIRPLCNYLTEVNLDIKLSDLEIVFITYVRVLLDLGVTINRLTLLDRRKISPYMMIMSLNKRRSLYMYPEFKCCRELFVCYDIGLIAPVFAHENDRFLSLQIFEVDESHVLYKRDLLEYLSSAP